MISFMFSLFGCFNVLDHFGGVPDPNASHPKKTHVFSLSKVVRVHVCSGLHLSVFWPITGHWSSQFSCQKPTAAICPSFSFKDGCVPAGQCISRLISRNVHEQARDKRRESNVLWPNKIQMKTRKKKNKILESRQSTAWHLNENGFKFFFSMKFPINKRQSGKSNKIFLINLITFLNRKRMIPFK